MKLSEKLAKKEEEDKKQKEGNKKKKETPKEKKDSEKSKPPAKNSPEKKSKLKLEETKSKPKQNKKINDKKTESKKTNKITDSRIIGFVGELGTGKTSRILKHIKKFGKMYFLDLENRCDKILRNSFPEISYKIISPNEEIRDYDVDVLIFRFRIFDKNTFELNKIKRNSRRWFFVTKKKTD